MNNIQRLLVLVLVWTGASYAQTKWDHITGKPYSIGTTAPVTCTIGDVFFKTNATAGQNLYGCTTTNTWTLIVGAVFDINGVVGSVTLGIGNTGLAPTWSGGTLNIPYAVSSDVTAGLLSKEQYNSFNSREPAISTGGITQYWRGDKAFASIQISDVTDLATTLVGKASVSHVHNASTDFTSGAVPAARGGMGADASGYTGFLRMSSGVPSASAIVTADLPAAIDFTGKDTTAPIKAGTSLPATCTVNQFFHKSDEAAGEGLHICTAANTWTAIVGTGGGGSLTTYSISAFSADFTSTDTITLAHNLSSTKQIISCYTTAGVELEPATVTIGSASSVVTLGSAESGTCTIVGGSGLYEESFTAQTSVNLDHDYNTTAVIVRCYDGDDAEVLPDSITTTDANNVTVAFTAEQTGRCVVVSSLATVGGAGDGTVTSVGVTGISGILTVTGSPVTTSGAMELSLDEQTAYKFLGVGATTAVPSFQTIPAAALAVMTGDSGSGGAKGAVPAPGTGDAAAGKYLDAGGTWSVPAGSGGGTGDTAILVGTATISSWGTIAAHTCTEKNITLTGAVGGDSIAPGWPPTLEAGLMPSMIAGTDVVVVRLCNVTASGIAVADSRTFRASILRSAI